MRVPRLRLCPSRPILCLALLPALLPALMPALIVALIASMGAASLRAAAEPSLLEASLAPVSTASHAALASPALASPVVASPVVASLVTPSPVVTSPATAQPAPAPESEQEEINGYLHSPAVHWIATKLHLDVNATSNIFVGINFLILFLLIAVPLARFMPKVIRKRSETLRHSIQTAHEVSENAQARLSAVEAKLAGLDGEIQKIRAQVEQEALEDQARIKASLEEEKTRIVAAAEQELNAAALQARRGLRTFAATLAIEQASQKLVLSAEADRALIAEFIANTSGDHAGLDSALRRGEQ